MQFNRVSSFTEKCHDIFNDCAERVSNALNCDDDPELQRGCRLSCNLCDQQHQPIGESIFFLIGMIDKWYLFTFAKQLT